MGMFNNVSVYRKMLRFTQDEFALMIGISQVYLSHIEVYRKPLLDDMAGSIAEKLNSIVGDIIYHEANIKDADEPDINLLDKIKPDVIRIGHNISKYSTEVQEKAYNKMIEISIANYEMEYMLETGKEPPEENLLNIEKEIRIVDSPEEIITKVLKYNSSEEILKGIKEKAKKEIKLRNMKMQSKMN